MNQLAEAIERVLTALDTKGWVKCPLCRDEYNKLHPCSYTDNGRTVGTYVCVTCAESIQSIHRVFEIMGIDAFIHPFLRKKPYDDLYRSYGDQFDNARAFKCHVENAVPLIDVWIESDGTRLIMFHVQGNSTVRFNNIFQCASYFRHLIQTVKNASKKEDKNTWGK